VPISGAVEGAPETAAAPQASPAPLRTLGRCIVWLLIASAVIDGLAAWADADQRLLFGRLLRGEPVSYVRATSSDDFVSATSTFQLVAFFTIVVVWLIWFRRAYVNAARSGGGQMRFSKGWTIGAWFVPFLNLVRPKQIADDIWRAGDSNSTEPFYKRSVPALLHWWWALWLIAGIAGNVAVRMLFSADTLADQKDAATVAMASDILSVGLDLLTVVVVWRITQRYERHRTQASPSGAVSDAGVAPAV
jgi:Domain of unknown function (DUF4328)